MSSTATDRPNARSAAAPASAAQLGRSACAAPPTRALLLALLVLTASLSACKAPPVARPPQTPSADALMERLASRRRHVKTLRAEARVTYWDDSRNERVKATVLFWASRDGRLRMDIDSPLGAVATLATDGTRLALLDTRKDRFYEGPATACAVAQFLPLALPPGHVVDALLGDAPLPEAPSARPAIDWDPVTAIWRLSGKGANGTTVLGFRQDFELIFAEAKTTTGELAYRLYHDELEDIAGVTVPKRSRIELAPGREVVFERRDMAVNLAPPPNAFTLVAPPGLPVTPLPCPPPLAAPPSPGPG